MLLHRRVSAGQCCIRLPTRSPAGLQAEEGDEWRSGLPPGLPELTIANPSYDYVPPELISLFVTGT